MACIEAPEGPLPVGAQSWLCETGDVEEGSCQMLPRTVTATLLPDEATLLAAEKRWKAEAAARNAPLAALARAQLDHVTALSIEGHWTTSVNGVYRREPSDHEGWPVLKNEQATYLYRHTVGFSNDWRASSDERGDWTEHSDCSAYIAAPEGPLPIGPRTWKCWIDQYGWRDNVLTVTLLETEAEAAASEERFKAQQ